MTLPVASHYLVAEERSMPAHQAGKLDAIQVLRAAAASLVVVHHFALAAEQYASNAPWLARSGLGALGASGVDLFFVISGFIMLHTTRGKFGVRAAREFVSRRLRRVYPTYWFWTSALLLLWLSGLALSSHNYSAGYILRSYLLLPVFDGKGYQPLLSQGWTLSFELWFYLVFALTLIFVKGAWRLVGLVAGLAAFAALARVLPLDAGLRYLLTEPIMVEFVLGAFAAYLAPGMATHSRVAARTIAWVLLALGVGALLASVFVDFPLQSRALFWGGPSFLIVLGAALLPSGNIAVPWIRLGDASYSIYLAHGFFSLAYGMALKRSAALRDLPADLTVLVGSAVTIPLTAATYWLIEKRLLQLTSSQAAPDAVRGEAAKRGALGSSAVGEPP